MTALKTQAIQTALLGDWESAIALNRALLKENPDDIETLNRLAFAYTIRQNISEAKATYQKVLKIDNQNPIALKNLKRLNENSKKGAKEQNGLAPKRTAQYDTMFIEENGKTKIIELVNIAQSGVITGLVTGEMLRLRVKRLKVFILDENDTYVGMLPDDIGKRLIKFIHGGNTYEACIQSVDKKRIRIFAKETKRVTRFKNQPSFLPTELVKIISQSKASRQQKEVEEEDREEE